MDHLRPGSMVISSGNRPASVSSALEDYSKPERSYRTLIHYISCIPKESLVMVSPDAGAFLKPINKVPLFFLMVIIGSGQAFCMTFFKYIGEFI